MLFHNNIMGPQVFIHWMLLFPNCQSIVVRYLCVVRWFLNSMISYSGGSVENDNGEFLGCLVDYALHVFFNSLDPLNY